MAKPGNPPTTTPVQDNQIDYFNDQETFSLDFDQLESSFLTPIDNIRSHFNALTPNPQDLNTPQYQESRCHAFYRMIGFPIVAPGGSSFCSPGFDPNINLNPSAASAYQSTVNAFSNNITLTNQSKQREQVPIFYSKIFAAGGLNSQGDALGSMFVRSFANQFSSTGPLETDPAQQQDVPERMDTVFKFYGPQGFSLENTISFQSLLSQHYLKPFIVDPRIDTAVKPIKNKICAPFLKDKSQTKIFKSSDGSSDSLQRPYIERVISVRFNNQNLAGQQSAQYIQTLLSDIRNNNNQVDPDLLAATSDPDSQIYNNELVIFNNYYKIIRIVIDELVSSIRDVQSVRQNINFDPIPSTKTGVEGGVDGGGKLASITPNDPNNKKWETNIITMMQNQAINNAILDAGLQGVPDPGDFAFSNLDDSVFSMQKNIQQSYEDKISKLTGYRNQLGDGGITDLRNIEIIMGEFSGIGLIDMLAIQAALWIMPANSLLGLIDSNAFSRMKQYRPDIVIGSATQNAILTSLTDFESTLKTIYLLIQHYYDSIYNGSASSAPGTS